MLKNDYIKNIFNIYKMSTNAVSNKASGSVTDYTVQDALGIQSEVAVVRGSFVIPVGTSFTYKYSDPAFLPSTPIICCYGSSPTASGVSYPLACWTGAGSIAGTATFSFGASTTIATNPLTVNYYIG